MKFPLWASIFTVIGVAILCGLGTWQIHRLAWKTELLADLERAVHAEPVDLPSTPPDSFVRVLVQGRYVHDKAIKLGPRTHEGAPGYHVLTPLQRPDGSYVMVNRGWISLDSDEVFKPVGAMSVTGLLRPVPRYNMFVPLNNPEANQWYRVVPQDMAAAKNIEPVYDGVLYAEPSAKQAGSYPVATVLGVHLPNNHRQYAVFWFAMAGVLVGVFFLRFFRASGKA